MKEILLHGPRSNGAVALVDDDDYENLNLTRWIMHPHGYAYGTVYGVVIPMHNFLLRPTKGMCADHINGNKTDNRRENIRITTRANNRRNSKVDLRNKSGVPGVTLLRNGNHKVEWTTGVGVRHAKTFKSFKEAASFRKAQDRRHGNENRLGSIRLSGYGDLRKSLLPKNGHAILKPLRLPFRHPG